MILVRRNIVEDLNRFNLPGSYGRSTFENPELADSGISRNFIYYAFYLVDTLLQLSQHSMHTYLVAISESHPAPTTFFWSNSIEFNPTVETLDLKQFPDDSSLDENGRLPVKVHHQDQQNRIIGQPHRRAPWRERFRSYCQSSIVFLYL
jgi:hypothetical protein